VNRVYTYGTLTKQGMALTVDAYLFYSVRLLLDYSRSFLTA